MGSLSIIQGNLRQTVQLLLNEEEIGAVLYAVSLAKAAAASNPALNARAGLWARNIDVLMKKSASYRKLSACSSLPLDPETYKLEISVSDLQLLTQFAMIAAEIIGVWDQTLIEPYQLFYQRLLRLRGRTL